MASDVFDASAIAAELQNAPDMDAPDMDALDAHAMARMLVARYPARAFELCEALSDHNVAIGNRPRAAAWEGIALEAVRLMARRRPRHGCRRFTGFTPPAAEKPAQNQNQTGENPALSTTPNCKN